MAQTPHPKWRNAGTHSAGKRLVLAPGIELTAGPGIMKTDRFEWEALGARSRTSNIPTLEDAQLQAEKYAKTMLDRATRELANH